MKKLILTFAVLFVTSITFSNNISNEVRPLVIYDCCGGNHELDDGGMTWDEIFDYSEFIDDFFCQERDYEDEQPFMKKNL